MKILSWNVNGIRACSKKGFTTFIQAEQPDIVCLQEVKALQNQAPEEFTCLYSNYEPVWHPASRPGYSGVLNLFRKKPTQVTLGMGTSQFDQEGRVLISDHGDSYLLNMYFPNGGSGPARHEFKMRFLNDILRFFKKLDSEKSLILTGDFNIAHRAIDIHDPVRLDGHSGFMPEEREWMDQLVSAGFVDAFRELHPEVKDAYSWWSFRQGARRRNKGWRIDYFFLSERLRGRIAEIRMLPEVMGSDHCPLVLTLK